MTTFISYAQKDAKIVARLRAELEELRGRTWIDASLSGGQDWWTAILAAIRESDLFVLALSPASMQSDARQLEVDDASAVNRPVLPIEVSPVDKSLFAHIRRLQINCQPF